MYLAAKLLEYNDNSSQTIIISAAGHSKSNNNIVFTETNHEEADTLMIYHAALATSRDSAITELVFYSPDRDVLVLTIANYDILPVNTAVSMVSGAIQVKPIWTALGVDKAKTLPAFHAFTGCDTNGRFSRIGKAT